VVINEPAAFVSPKEKVERIDFSRVTKGQLVAILKVDVKKITIWQNQGLPFEEAKAAGEANHYDVAQVVRWWIKQESRGGLDLQEERAKLTALQSETAELKNAKLAGTMIDLEAAVAVAQRAAFAIRQRIVNLNMSLEDKRALLEDIHALGETDFTKTGEEEGDNETEDDAAKTSGKSKVG
jgi:phage terminase Nu1 subunit (DNA packaging protein)